ncbi:hypothetical protein [Botrimarina mediterranea]|uniref:Uncharacterized protein n=1 Tax=Botrimarina mediterranea TaxID=2528022 RepID=A0A518K234_9BACT|nr:hypothetical protein [Botrimarina mediterranea]QDV71871.1 hypothetical protein Spa11_00400 [Botrimarina mediterranea]
MNEFLDEFATLSGPQLAVVAKIGAAAMLVGILGGGLIASMWGRLLRASAGLALLIAIGGGLIYLLVQSREERSVTLRPLPPPPNAAAAPVAPASEEAPPSRAAGPWWK